jgi:hypothetical protein
VQLQGSLQDVPAGLLGRFAAPAGVVLSGHARSIAG